MMAKYQLVRDEIPERAGPPTAATVQAKEAAAKALGRALAPSTVLMVKTQAAATKP
jgi:hypothetical protein